MARYSCRLAAAFRAAVLLGLLASSGCSSDEPSITGSEPVLGPETEVLATRMGGDEEGVRYHFAFAGSSPASTIDGFEWQLGPLVSVDAIEAGPAADSWIQSAEAELELTLSFEAAGGNGAQAIAADRGSRSLWVRALDARGQPDPTPSRVTMTAQSIAPEVVIDFPQYLPTTACLSAGRLQTFGWTATDPDATPGVLETRYILFPVGGPTDPCLTFTGYTGTMPIAADDPLWSNWAVFDPDAPTLDPSRSVNLPPQPVGNSFLFAVQARDATGATTTSLQWGWNVRHYRVSDGRFPLLAVHEDAFGTQSFVSDSGVRSYEVLANESLSFSWEAEAYLYVGYIVGYRYGWSVVDPNDPLDPGWVGPWSMATEAVPRTFAQGSHNFVVQAIDNSGVISRATFILPALQVPPRSEQRDVLLVVDWPTQGDPVRDVWVDDLVGVIDDLVFGFDDRRDVIDAQTETSQLSLAKLLDYRSVVWFTGANDQTFLHTRIAPPSSGVSRYNWVEAYQRRGGNLLLAGPGAAYNSIERNPPTWLFPILFDTSSSGALGLGPMELPGGDIINRGTLRWPYSGWGLSSVDLVRPAFTQIFGERPGTPLRLTPCDQLARAEVSPRYLARHANAAGALVDLLPNADRLASHPSYQLSFEEFYDVNVTTRNVTVWPRHEQVPMFVHRAMRDEGHVNDPSQCPPSGSATSVIDGAAVAIESSVYSSTKPLMGSHDFLWGFHPLGFEEEGLRAALRWIFLNDWELATAKR